MKTLLIALSFLFTAQAIACSCSYDYGKHNPEFMNRAGVLLGLPGTAVKMTDYELTLAPMAYADPIFYNNRTCGCTMFVKRIWSISYQREGMSCTAKAVLQEWNNKMKIRQQECI